MKSFRTFIQEDWKRAALVGGTTIGASALTGAATGLGTLPGAAIGAAYYLGSGEAKKDWKHKEPAPITKKKTVSPNKNEHLKGNQKP